jgi:hypothetical protein
MTYRNVRQARTAERQRARRRVKQHAHSLVLHAQGTRTTKDVATIATKATRWWEDLRRGRLSPYGSLFRFIDVSKALGVPREMLDVIPQVVSWYIADSYDPTTTGEIKLVA